MAQLDVFSFAASITALLVAAGFLVAYLANRGLSAFRWWAVAFLLIAIALATATLRFGGPSYWIKSLSWASFLGAASVIALGLFRSGATRTNPLWAILACALLYVGLAAALIATVAPPHMWFLLGPAPTLVLMGWALVPMLRARAWGYSLALGAGMAVVALRAAWFTMDLIRMGPIRRPLLRGSLPPDGLPPEAIRPGPIPPAQGLVDFRPPAGVRAPVEQPLTIALITIAALLALAIALVLRDLLLSVDKLRERSSTDAMTGLLNRVTFEETASNQLQGAGDRPTCLVLLDIDHFKRINDTAGHAAGDRVIERLGQLVGEMNLIKSIAGRVGGEEFAVLLPGGDINTARLYAEAIRTGLSTSDFGDEIGWGVTLSAGIARHRPGESLASLTARADKALYAAKAGGRDRVMVEEGPAPAAMRRSYGT